VSTVVLGKVTSMPIGIAPMAMQKLAHPDGEIAMAKGLDVLVLKMQLSIRNK